MLSTLFMFGHRLPNLLISIQIFSLLKGMLLMFLRSIMFDTMLHHECMLPTAVWPLFYLDVQFKAAISNFMWNL